MNEPETREELIDPKLKTAGWGAIEDSKILCERTVCKITDDRIQAQGKMQIKKILFDFLI